MIYPSTSSKRFFPVIYDAESKFCWDENGIKYLDFTGANNTVILGYKKLMFSFPPNFPGKSILETKVSELLSKYTKTKHFRFFKNGSDAVSCAIRLARYLLHEKPTPSILYSGYAGSHNEYAYLINKNGIPEQNSSVFSEKERYSEKNILVFESRFHKKIKNLKFSIKICDHLKSGILGLYENIDANFHIYGKSLANGYPISVLTGNDEEMKMINQIYYSTTFGGENTGLEAIKLTMEEFNRSRNRYLKIFNYAKKKLPKWKSLDEKKINQLISEKILCNGYWQIMIDHTKEDIDLLAEKLK